MITRQCVIRQRWFAEKLSQSLHHLRCVHVVLLDDLLLFQLFFLLYNRSVNRENLQFNIYTCLQEESVIWWRMKTYQQRTSFDMVFCLFELNWGFINHSLIQSSTQLCVQCEHWCMFLSTSFPLPVFQCVRVHLVHITFVLWSHGTLSIFHHDGIRLDCVSVSVCPWIVRCANIFEFDSFTRIRHGSLVVLSPLVYECNKSVRISLGRVGYSVCVVVCASVLVCVWPEYVNFLGEGVCIYTYVLIIDSFIQIRIIDTRSRPLV